MLDRPFVRLIELLWYN